MEDLRKRERRVVQRLQNIMDSREPTLRRYPGLLGQSNDQGSATVPGKPSWCYVRVGNDETQATVYNNRTPHTNGMAVIVGYDPAQPTLFQVLAARSVYDTTQPAVPGSGPHHSSHEWGNSDGGDDIVYLRLRQLLDCLVYVTSPTSMTVNVADGVYAVGQAVDYYVGGTIDLTSFVPSSGYVWILIALGESGIYTVVGTTKTSVNYLDIPAATSGDHWRLAAVRLHSTTTSITDWPDTQMIVDLRLAATRQSDTSYKILLYSGDRTEYAVSDTGMAVAVAAAVSGDTILVPPGTFISDYSIPGGVTVVGTAVSDTFFSGQITLHNTSELQGLSVYRSKDDTLTYYGVVGPDTGIAYIRNCRIRVLQAGAGSAYGISCHGRDGDEENQPESIGERIPEPFRISHYCLLGQAG